LGSEFNSSRRIEGLSEEKGKKHLQGVGGGGKKIYRRGNSHQCLGGTILNALSDSGRSGRGGHRVRKREKEKKNAQFKHCFNFGEGA